MNRKEKVFHRIDENGVGLEIGPSHRPFAPKSQGYNVEIIDHLSREQLLEKYKGHGVDLQSVEEVDHVWSGQSFEDLTGKSKFYDYIIASHVVEHAPDLVRFLQDCSAVLKDDGVVSLVIPDKRYCFDHFRPITGISRIVDAYFGQQKIHSPGSVAEYFLSVVAKSGNIAWNKYRFGNYSFMHSSADAKNGIDSVTNDGGYVDVHAWCFTPSSFRLIMHDLFLLGLIDLREICFFGTHGCEFYVTLGKHGSGPDKDRLGLLADIELELASGAPDLMLSKMMSALKFWRR